MQAGVRVRRPEPPPLWSSGPGCGDATGHDHHFHIVDHDIIDYDIGASDHHHAGPHHAGADEHHRAGRCHNNHHLHHHHDDHTRFDDDIALPADDYSTLLSSRQAPLTPRGTYTEWRWPAGAWGRTAAGYRSFEHGLVPEIDPGPDAPYFWAHQFQLVGGEGGYLGLQTRGNRADGSVGKTAIFSVWSAVAAEGRGAMPFAGEGTGWSCRIPYLWAAGRPYRLRLWSEGSGWWAASVLDERAGVEEAIGRIRVPAQWGHLGSWSVMWTEYYGGPLASCHDLPHSQVVFKTPVADGGVLPERSENRLGPGTCEGSRIEALPDGVRQEMGVPALKA